MCLEAFTQRTQNRKWARGRGAGEMEWVEGERLRERKAEKVDRRVLRIQSRCLYIKG